MRAASTANFTRGHFQHDSGGAFHRYGADHRTAFVAGNVGLVFAHPENEEAATVFVSPIHVWNDGQLFIIHTSTVAETFTCATHLFFWRIYRLAPNASPISKVDVSILQLDHLAAQRAPPSLRLSNGIKPRTHFVKDWFVPHILGPLAILLMRRAP